MKTAIIIHDNIRQIVFTPETESDKEVCNMFTPDKQIELAIKRGSVYGSSYSRNERFGIDVYKTQGDYLRATENKESVMLILKPKESKPEFNESPGTI